jgi:2-phosphoglycerate kinase
MENDLGMTPEEGKKTARITILDKERHSLPFSKGLTANGIMASGLAPGQAYSVASDVEEHLVSKGQLEVQAKDLRDLIYNLLKEKTGEHYAVNYWRYISFS